MLTESNPACPELVAEVIKRDQFRVLELLAKEGALVDRKLLPLIHLIGIRLVDIVMGLGELSSIA